MLRWLLVISMTAGALLSIHSTSFAAGDAAAYESSVADLTRQQPLSNRPNELSFLIQTGERWCSDKAALGLRGDYDSRVKWLVGYKATHAEAVSLTSDEGAAEEAAVEQANKLLCP